MASYTFYGGENMLAVAVAGIIEKVVRFCDARAS